MSNVWRSVFEGNVVKDGIKEGIYCDEGGGFCYFTNNTLETNGYNGFVTLSSWNHIIGNTAFRNTRHGIVVELGDDCVVSGNIVSENDYANSATYDGIFIGGGSDNNVINNNICRDNDRYEINVSAATCDKNAVVGNVLNGTDHAGNLNDAGTGTVAANNVT